jgi:precorrin-3B synthase
MTVEQDRCPGVLRLHEAADGLLARVRLPGGRITPAQLHAVTVGAVFGNGIIELTSRASLQIRGLSDGAVSEVLADADLLPSMTHERVRNILASPLAGRHPLSRWDTDETVAALDRAICDDPELAELSGRFLFGVDDGSGLLGHDVDVMVRPHGSVTGAIAVARAALRGQPITVMPPTGGRFRIRAAGSAVQLALGPLTQRDGRIALTFMPPLGRLDPSTAYGLAELGYELRLSVHRTLTILDLSLAEAVAVEGAVNALGMISDPQSGWIGLTACAGLGACGRAELDARALAADRAEQRQPGAQNEHWAACARGCGLTEGARLMGVIR